MHGRCITPAQSVPDHKDEAAHDPAIIDPRNAVPEWEIRLDPVHPRLAQRASFRQQQRLLSAAIEAGRVHSTINPFPPLQAIQRALSLGRLKI